MSKTLSDAVVGRMVSSIHRRVVMPRVRRRAALDVISIDLMNVAGRCAVNGDAPRLHGLGNFPQQFDLQQAVVEGRALYLYVIRQAELALEHPRRNTSVNELVFGLLRLVAFDGDDVLFGGDGDLVGREPRDRQRDLVPVVGQPLDVVRWVVVFASPLGGLNQVEEAVEADVDRKRGDKS